MPLTTVADVIQVGSLDDADAYRLFRLASSVALATRIDTEIALAEAYIATTLPVAYASTNAHTLLLLGRAATYLCLQQLVESLKARKLEGTQWALDQEETDRFQAMVDVEYERQADRLLNLFGGDETGTALCLPTFSVGGELATTGRETSAQRLAALLEESSGLLPPLVETLQQGTGTG